MRIPALAALLVLGTLAVSVSAQAGENRAYLRYLDGQEWGTVVLAACGEMRSDLERANCLAQAVTGVQKSYSTGIDIPAMCGAVNGPSRARCEEAAYAAAKPFEREIFPMVSQANDDSEDRYRKCSDCGFEYGDPDQDPRGSAGSAYPRPIDE